MPHHKSLPQWSKQALLDNAPPVIRQSLLELSGIHGHPRQN
jgi:hypothetical protein